MFLIWLAAHKRVQEDDFRTVDPATCSALVLPDFCYVTDLSTNTCISCTTSDAFPTISVEIKVRQYIHHVLIGTLQLQFIHNVKRQYCSVSEFLLPFPRSEKTLLQSFYLLKFQI